MITNTCQQSPVMSPWWERDAPCDFIGYSASICREQEEVYDIDLAYHIEIPAVEMEPLRYKTLEELADRADRGSRAAGRMILAKMFPAYALEMLRSPGTWTGRHIRSALDVLTGRDQRQRIEAPCLDI